MSVEVFVQEILEKNRTEMDELKEMLKVLEQLRTKRPRISAFHVTNNA